MKKQYKPPAAHKSPPGSNLGRKPPRHWAAEICALTDIKERRAALAKVTPVEWQPLVRRIVEVTFMRRNHDEKMAKRQRYRESQFELA